MMEGDWIPTEKPLFVVRMCINKRLNTDRLPSCGGGGSRGVADALEWQILAERIPASVTRGPFMNNCLNGPNLKIQGADYFNLKGDISEIALESIMAAIRAEADLRKSAMVIPQADHAP